MTSLDASPDVSLDKEQQDPGMLVGDVEEHLEAARGYEPEAEGPSTVEQPNKQPVELGTGEAHLQLGSPEASDREGTPL